MIKFYPLAVIGYSLALLAPMTAEEKKVEKPETAWAEYDIDGNTNGFIFGTFNLPENFISLMFAGSDDEGANTSGGSGNKRSEGTVDLGPIVDINHLPHCLPPHPEYRDVSEQFRMQGINVEGKQWILYSGGLQGDHRLYYCLSVGDSDILEVICRDGHCSEPFNFIHKSTLVSVPHQGFSNQAWTMARLATLDYTVHARHGTVSRSGERALLDFQQKGTDHANYLEIEAVLGESAEIADVRIGYSQAWGEKNQVEVAQNTAFTAAIDTPFIIDSGIHGKEKRNYLLVTETAELKGIFKHSGHQASRTNLKKIEGVYAMRTTPETKEKKFLHPTFTTEVYHCGTDFLTRLQTALYSSGSDQDDPFGENKNPAKIPAPVRIRDYKPNKHLESSDTIYDITPQCRILGLATRNNETIYYNATKSRLIITGSLATQVNMVSIIESLSSTIRMVKCSARIVEVDSTSLESPLWSFDKISKSNPQTHAMFATTARSGELAFSGKEMASNTSKNKEGKEITSRDYEFEIEPTIGESNQKIDLRFAIHSQPLGQEKIAINLETAMTIPDGKPAIIELGHPNSGTRTHLLILSVDLISPDGSFYRDRFKPIEE